MLKPTVKKYLLYLARCAQDQNEKNIMSFFETDLGAKICDLGVDDGIKFMKVVKPIGSENLYGCDINPQQLRKASKLGIIVPNEPTDLNRPLTYPDNFFEVVYSAFTIEHLVDLDSFVKEIFRILKPDGYVIISTENLSSWHNIFALLCGYQAFSQIISRRVYGIGNPLSINRGQKIFHESWSHIHILTYKGLIELFEFYGFKVDEIKGAGYHPFPYFISKLLSKLDPRHSVYITLKARKVVAKEDIEKTLISRQCSQ